MAQPNHLNPDNIDYIAPSHQPMIVDAELLEATARGNLTYQVRPAGTGLLTKISEAVRIRLNGLHTAPHDGPEAEAVEQSETEEFERDLGNYDPARLVAEMRPDPVVDPATNDEVLWRTAVMHVLGKHTFNPVSLQKRLPGTTEQEINTLVGEMQNRGILGRLDRRMGGYEVVQSFTDSPEALMAVALHLARTKAAFVNNLLDRVEHEHQLRVQQSGNNADNDQLYREASILAAREIHHYAGNVENARKSLNIPIPQMHQIINKLDFAGFLAVPIIARGADFDQDPDNQTERFRHNRKWMQLYPQWERIGSRVYTRTEELYGSDALRDVYEHFPAPFNMEESRQAAETNQPRQNAPRNQQQENNIPAWKQESLLRLAMMSDGDKQRLRNMDNSVESAIIEARFDDSHNDLWETEFNRLHPVVDPSEQTALFDAFVKTKQDEIRASVYQSDIGLSRAMSQPEINSQFRDIRVLTELDQMRNNARRS